jgi:NAD-dependent DNA ligase
MTPHEYEVEVMAHRYLYYVLAEPQLPDLVYDQLEREARKVLPSESPVQKVGSSLSSSYNSEHIKRANQLQGFD